jgi:hypothetical protein
LYIFFLLRLFDFQLPQEASLFLERKRLRLLEKKALEERIKRDFLSGRRFFLLLLERDLRHVFS